MKAKLIYVAIVAQLAFDGLMLWKWEHRTWAFDPASAVAEESGDWVVKVSGSTIMRNNRAGLVEFYDRKAAKWVGLGHVSRDGLTAQPQ